MGTALGIDLGTSGLRVAVVDAAGRAVAQAGVPLPPARATEPSAWLEALEAALTWMPLEAVRRIAVAGTSGTLLAVDAAGAPVGPPAMYNAPAPAEAVAAVARLAPTDSQAQLRQSHWEISRKPLILRGETGEIPVFSEYVVPFLALFSA
jgi:sugar (pentulose or hexulose) kinase